MEIHPYLNFNGRCEEAIEFYRRALDAKLEMLMRFDENPEPPKDYVPAPGTEKKVMHASMRIGEAVIMATDGQCTATETFQGISLSLFTDTAAEADRVFAALADGGQVTMPLARTFFSERFGMLADRFGVHWMILVKPSQHG